MSSPLDTICGCINPATLPADGRADDSGQALGRRWEVVRPIVDRVLQVVGLERGGERRTLRPVNPGLPYGTTPVMKALGLYREEASR